MHTHFGGLGADYFADMWRKFAGRAGPVKVPLSPLLHTAAARAGLRVSVKVIEGESFAVRPAVRRE